jgi:hypothetical protein
MKGKKTESNEGQDTKRSTRPTHVAYWVKDRGEDRASVWRAIGVAWEHADGKGFNVLIDLLPPDGRITLRVPEEKAE